MFLISSETLTTESYTLPLHDALPISHEEFDHDPHIEDGRDIGDRGASHRQQTRGHEFQDAVLRASDIDGTDRKSTRLNSSHVAISYAVFCLKQKRKDKRRIQRPIETQ